MCKYFSDLHEQEISTTFEPLLILSHLTTAANVTLTDSVALKEKTLPRKKI